MGLYFGEKQMTETESYNGCALEPVRPFESRAEADEYVRTHPPAVSRVVKVNADGAAV